MKQLQLYTAPAAELFVIRFEQNILSGEILPSSGSQFADEADFVDGSSENWW